MRVMVLVKATEDSESEVSPAPSTELLEDMVNYNGELVNAGWRCPQTLVSRQAGGL